MGKVIRTDKDGVQKIRANEIVPGDIVEVSGELPGHWWVNRMSLYWVRTSRINGLSGL